MAAAGLSVFAVGVEAQVLEIDEAGVVRVYDGPIVMTDGAATAIAQNPARSDRGSTSAEMVQHITDAAAAYRLDRELLEAVAWRESRFKQAALSGRGATGVMQLMPSTARDLGVDPHNTRQNIFGGAAYLRALLSRFGGDVPLALAAYNAGPGAVLRYGGVPPFAETRNYVAAITGRVAQATARMAEQVAAVPSSMSTVLAPN